MNGSAAIAGIGQTEFSMDSGRSELTLACEAVSAALDDCGVAPAEVDGLVTYSTDLNNEVEVARSTGIGALTFYVRTGYGGGGTCAAILQAAMAVATGVANAVVVYRAFNERSKTRYGRPQPVAGWPDYVRRNAGGGSRWWPWYLPFGLGTPAQWSSIVFQHYMHRYGVTNEDFGRYAVLARTHAATNPAAFYAGKPLSLEEHQGSRWIVEPVLRRYDCCLESDGGIALVITSAARARDLRHPPAVIAAAAQGLAVNGDVVSNYFRDDLARFAELELVADQLWRQSGLTVDDIDAAMIYDHFSPIVLMQLEAVGFCGPGEAKDFLADGNGTLDSPLPINTHGGLLGEAYIHGVNHITEATRQLRGTAANQLSSVDHVLVTAGMSGLILSRG